MNYLYNYLKERGANERIINHPSFLNAVFEVQNYLNKNVRAQNYSEEELQNAYNRILYGMTKVNENLIEFKFSTGVENVRRENDFDVLESSCDVLISVDQNNDLKVDTSYETKTINSNDPSMPSYDLYSLVQIYNTNGIEMEKTRKAHSYQGIGNVRMSQISQPRRVTTIRRDTLLGGVANVTFAYAGMYRFSKSVRLYGEHIQTLQLETGFDSFEKEVYEGMENNNLNLNDLRTKYKDILFSYNTNDIEEAEKYISEVKEFAKSEIEYGKERQTLTEEQADFLIQQMEAGLVDTDGQPTNNQDVSTNNNMTMGV